MDLFEFCRWALILTVSSTLYFPLTMPLAALAFRIQLGTRKFPFDEDEGFWWRCALAALGLSLLSGVVLLLDWFLVSSDMPAGIVHIALLMAYLPAAVWHLFWSFACDDLGEGLGILVVYILLPSLLLGLLLLFGVRFPITLAESWIGPAV